MSDNVNCQSCGIPIFSWTIECPDCGAKQDEWLHGEKLESRIIREAQSISVRVHRRPYDCLHPKTKLATYLAAKQVVESEVNSG